eukprot:EG_transcript_8200
MHVQRQSAIPWSSATETASDRRYMPPALSWPSIESPPWSPPLPPRLTYTAPSPQAANANSTTPRVRLSAWKASHLQLSSRTTPRRNPRPTSFPSTGHASSTTDVSGRKDSVDSQPQLPPDLTDISLDTSLESLPPAFVQSNLEHPSSPPSADSTPPLSPITPGSQPVSRPLAAPPAPPAPAPVPGPPKAVVGAATAALLVLAYFLSGLEPPEESPPLVKPDANAKVAPKGPKVDADLFIYGWHFAPSFGVPGLWRSWLGQGWTGIPLQDEDIERRLRFQLDTPQQAQHQAEEQEREVRRLREQAERDEAKAREELREMEVEVAAQAQTARQEKLQRLQRLRDEQEAQAKRVTEPGPQAASLDAGPPPPPERKVLAPPVRSEAEYEELFSRILEEEARTRQQPPPPPPPEVPEPLASNAAPAAPPDVAPPASGDAGPNATDTNSSGGVDVGASAEAGSGSGKPAELELTGKEGVEELKALLAQLAQQEAEARRRRQVEMEEEKKRRRRIEALLKQRRPPTPPRPAAAP